MTRAHLASIAALLLTACSATSSPVTQVPVTTTLSGAGLTAPVDIVRDEQGIPHIYGSSMGDVFYAQGYVEGMDRLVQMDFLRRNAEGSLAELFGGLSKTIIDSDINMRTHHLRATAQQSWELLKASTDPADQRFVKAVGQFAAGINAYAADLKRGKYSIPTELALFYQPEGWRDWNEVDSVMLLGFETFYFNFSAGGEIGLTQLRTRGKSVFDDATDPALKARAGLGLDLWPLAPLDPTHTIDGGWTGMNGDTTHASLGPLDRDGNLDALLDADRRALQGIGRGEDVGRAASNNWVVAPSLTANGHALLANDTHVPLQNPSIWYLVHLVNRGSDQPFDAFGEAVAGVPSIVLGMNQHVAWGATTDQIDLTDVYQEAVVPCAGGAGSCVQFNGAPVALVPRQETFNIGSAGTITSTVTLTYYDVPHHGPILPRVTATHGLEPLGQTELSVKYVGYQPDTLIRVLERVLHAGSVDELVAALDRDNRTAGFNWVAADDQGHIGWTQVAALPRRAPGHAPYLVLPGDGSAEWGADLDPRYIPHAFDPAQGFLATANADPIGVSDDGEPFFDEPVVDGAPLYIAWDFADGARVGRVTKRLQAYQAAGTKVGLDEMASIQADTTSEHGQALNPVLVDAATALAEEIATPGTHAELAALVAAARADVKAQVPMVKQLAAGWSFETPSGLEDGASAAQIADSQATTIFHVFIDAFLDRTFKDELQALGMTVAGSALFKALARACLQPSTLQAQPGPNGDPIVFDDLTTTGVVETKRQTAAAALLDAIGKLLDQWGPTPDAWRWGNKHTLTLDFFVPLDPLKIPLKSDPQSPNGFARHGAPETVDPGGGHGERSYTYNHGPGIRFVVELDPVKGPIARNVLPGGETFDPTSPHYRDQMELWRKNQSFPLVTKDADVVTSAMAEYGKNQLGRIHLQPK